MKTCKGCNKSKTEDQYRGNRGKCRKCEVEQAKKRRKKYPEKERAAQKRWKQKNQEKCRAIHKRFKQKHPHYDTQWREKNPEKVKLRDQRRKAKPSFKIQRRLRDVFRAWLFKGAKSARTERLVGCTREEARNWIEAQILPGMTWENYGAWHIDHMLPWEHFNLLDEGTHIKVMHYTNLQPLWGPDNEAKGSKVIYDMEWRDTWYIHTGTEYVCRKIQVENKIQIKIKPIAGFTQGFAHAFMTN